MNVLDITHEQARTKEQLHDRIVAMVKDTQRVLIRELPNILLMTKKQFKLLARNDEMRKLYESEEMFYYTKFNAMQIEVKDAKM